MAEEKNNEMLPVCSCHIDESIHHECTAEHLGDPDDAHCRFSVSAVVSLLLLFKTAFLVKPRAWLKCLLLQLLWLNQSSCVIQGQPGLGLFFHPFCLQLLGMHLLTKELIISFMWTICIHHIIKRTPSKCGCNCSVQKYLFYQTKSQWNFHLVYDCFSSNVHSCGLFCKPSHGCVEHPSILTYSCMYTYSPGESSFSLLKFYSKIFGKYKWERSI